MKRHAGLSTYENEGEVQLGLVAGGPAFTGDHAVIVESVQALLQVCENLGVQANEVHSIIILSIVS